MWFLQSNITLQQILMRLLSVVVIIFLILPLHEWAHGFAAYKLGDPTAKNRGRLTFNPVASVDPIGALSILLFGLGWAKPVPVDSSYFKNPKRDMAITALCGPISNIVAALFGGIFLNGVYIAYSYTQNELLGWAVTFFMYYVIINIGLAIFNLIPIPPLDGSRILAAFLPDKYIYKYYQYQHMFIFILIALLFFGFLSAPIWWAQNKLYEYIIWLTQLPFRAFI